MKNLVWLASYPRSGNTWLRIFLSNLTRRSTVPDSINHLASTPILESPVFLEGIAGYDVALHSHREIETLLPQAVRWISETHKTLSYHKIHSVKQIDVITPEVTKLVIYLVRNPLDVCVSFSHFRGDTNFDKTIEVLSNPMHRLSNNDQKFPSQFPQYVSSWSQHVESWTRKIDCPTLIVRYEDLYNSPKSRFGNIAQALGIDCTERDIEIAIENSSFSQLRGQEAQHGFNERPKSSNSFFKFGRPGAWLHSLNKSQITKIIDNHRIAMRRFGYIDENSNPLS